MNAWMDEFPGTHPIHEALKGEPLAAGPHAVSGLTRTQSLREPRHGDSPLPTGETPTWHTSGGVLRGQRITLAVQSHVFESQLYSNHSLTLASCFHCLPSLLSGQIGRLAEVSPCPSTQLLSLP